MGVLSTNYAQIVPGALISASYVSDIYDVLMGSEPESIIISGSLTISGSTISTRGFTGSLRGTASYAATASYVLYYDSASLSDFATTASYSLNSITSSYALTANSSSYALTTDSASYSLTTDSASYSLTSISSSYSLTTDSASYSLTSISSSYALATDSASYALTASYVLNAPGGSSITIATSSMHIYVSISGSNSSNGLSSVQPLQTLYAAKQAAVSGSIVYVMPGEYVFDNSAGALNSTLSQINLWKNGVTYYFMPGAKVKFINHGNVGTPNGSPMVLFNATSTTNETCTVLGHLEFEQTGVGPDNSNGHNNFFKVGSDGGGTFYAQVKSLVSNHTPIVDISKSNTAGTVFNVTIISDEERWRYLGGQTGTGCCHFVYGNGSDATLNLKIYSRHRDYQYAGSQGCGIFVRNIFSTTSTIDINGETCFNSRHELLQMRSLVHKNVNININQIYHDYNSYVYESGTIVTTVDQSSTSNYILNITGDIIDYNDNTYTSGLFYIINPNSKLNYKGNIYTRSSGGGGRYIVLCTNGAFGTGYSSNNEINIDANIYFLGTADTTNYLFHSYGANNVINFTGTINGNFRTVAVPANGSSVTLNNARIQSTVTDNALLYYGGSAGSTIKISNSYIKMANSSSPLTAGQNTVLTVNNSFIANTGLNHTLYSANAVGSVQLLNSSVYATGSNSLTVNYTSSVITANSVINTAASGSITGSFISLPEMIL